MVLDSNIIIYAAQPSYSQVRAFVAGLDHVLVSGISYPEVFGYHGLTLEEERRLERIFLAATVVPVSESLLRRAAGLRRQRRKCRTADAIIAATALHHGVPLVTCNVTDFRWIEGLDVIDPLAEAG